MAIHGRWKIGAAVSCTLPALALRCLHLQAPCLAELAIYGGAVVAAAFLLCWAAEAVQADISAGLATALLALIAVLPEYAIDIYFAFSAGSHPAMARYAAANMTGSNRLLLGLGWPLVLFLLLLWARRRKQPVTGLAICPGRRIELGILGLASLYALLLPLRRGIHWIDGVVLLGLYGLYSWRLSREERSEPDLVGVAARLGGLPWAARRATLTAMFLWAALVVAFVSKPFADALLCGGRTLGLDEFLLVQWVAPLATEAPEFLVAALLALRGDSDTALGALLSSKVNQWTLLVGCLPLAFLAGGGHGSLPLDPRQVEEFWLTSAQALLGFAVLVNLSLSRWEASALLGLFAVQFALQGTAARLGLAGVYGVLAGGILWAHRRELPALVRAFTRSAPRPSPEPAGPAPTAPRRPRTAAGAPPQPARGRR